MDGGAACSIFDFPQVSAFTAIGDIVTDAVVEQNCVLRDDADRGAQTGLRYVAYILTVDDDPPAGCVVKAVEQPGDGRFASTRWTNDRRISRSPS
jgi:hypothetical protein